ncbi:MAG: MFS transporter [Candidatus Nezhaarchaeota archaeon]|nr:MFS transporter [Candidatus Nezhaarchaeota archaeon]MCX8142351.1 MFS transporter [Candidatus Nezhaarchaeota archaeon]MDW8050676.1 MFS transporter [Nitrososphaerota archaeon]
MKSQEVKNFFLIWLLGFFTSYARSVFYPLIPLLVQELRLSFSQVGALTSVTHTMYALLQLPCGYLTDRVGFKRTMTGGAIISILGLALGSVSIDYSTILVAQALIGIGGAVSLTPAISAVAAMFTKTRRGFAEGLLLSHITASVAFSLLVGGLLAETFSWRSVYAIATILMVTTMLLFAMLVREPPTSRRSNMDLRMMSKILNSNSLLLITCITTEVIGFQAMLTYVPKYLVDAGGLTPGAAASLTALAYLTAMVSRPLIGRTSDFVGRKPMIIATMLTGSAFFYLLMLNPSDLLIETTLFICWGLTFNGMYPVAVALITDVSERELRGLMVGLVTSTSTFIGGLLQERIGFMIDVFGYQAFFTVLALVPAIGSFLCIPVKEAKKP